jgi:hypothetical protein
MQATNRFNKLNLVNSNNIFSKNVNTGDYTHMRSIIHDIILKRDIVINRNNKLLLSKYLSTPGTTATHPFYPRIINLELRETNLSTNKINILKKNLSLQATSSFSKIIANKELVKLVDPSKNIIFQNPISLYKKPNGILISHELDLEHSNWEFISLKHKLNDGLQTDLSKIS